MQGMDFETDLTGKTHSDLARFKKGGVDVQVFSVFCDDTYGVGTAFKFANREIDSLYAIAGRNPDKMQIVTDVAGLEKAVKHHRLAAMIGVEGGHMIEDNIDYLDSFYRRGVRYMTLTWNNSTPWATSATDETSKAFTVTPYGLTGHGKAIVAKAPTYAVNEFISKKYPQEADSLRAPLSLLIDHIDYIVKMIGPDHVGLGSDFDGIESPPQQLNDVTTYPLITRELLKRGYKPEDIVKILGGNFIRVLKANEVPEPPAAASASVTL
jgi:microsomal dipeptidase-like Zn-dependent dipeptidase